MFYAGLTVLLVLCMVRALPHLLPRAPAHHVADDSESYLFALVLAAWVEHVRPRAGRPGTWPATAAVSLLCLVAGVLLYRPSGVPASVRTLTETLVALAVLLPYVTVRRRPSPRAAVVAALVLLVAVVVAEHTPLAQLTTDFAEAVGMLLLAPLAFDVADRAALRPQAPGPARLRLAWWGVLVVVPVVCTALRHRGLPGWLPVVIDYGARAQEAFVGLLLVELYLALRTRLAGRAPASPRDGAPGVGLRTAAAPPP